MIKLKLIDIILIVSIIIVGIFLGYDVSESNQDPANQEIIHYYQQTHE